MSLQNGVDLGDVMVVFSEARHFIGRRGGVYIGDIISSRDSRDYTLSIEDNDLSGREILKQ